MKYTVVEIQNGVVGQNVWTFDDVNAAESKYHTALSFAATSSVNVHSVVLLNAFGYCIKHESYTHEESGEN
jgi:hypothetical protein